MKFSIAKFAFYGFALTTTTFSSVAFGQLPTSGTTSGIGGATTGFGGATTGTGGTTGAAGTAQRLPGAFGGPGITGSPIIEYSNINVSKAFVSPNSPSGTSTGTAGTTGQIANPASAFGANAFGGNAAGGANAGGMGGMGGGLGGGMGGLGRVGGLGGIGGLGGLGGGAGNRNNAKSKIRIIAKAQMEEDRPRSGNANNGAANAQARFGRIPLPAKLRGVNASFVDGQVVLSGKVSSEADKRLVERLVKLEPGVDSVKNEVQVQPKPSEEVQAEPNR